MQAVPSDVGFPGHAMSILITGRLREGLRLKPYMPLKLLICEEMPWDVIAMRE
jgi:hypothetical protein